MTRSLKNILIPVDFSINTEIVLEKIISLIEPFDSTIHLLHIAKPLSLLSRYQKKLFVTQTDVEQQSAEAVKMKLYELKQNLLKLFPSVNISTDVITGRNIQNKIIEQANQLTAELIVTIKNTNRKWLSLTTAVNATHIAKETNSAVMIVNRSAIPNKIKSIVLPVCTVSPDRNIELLSALTGKYKPVVHLVTTSDKHPSTDKTNIFINTYRTLSDLLHYPVDYKVLSSSNFFKDVLGYGRNIMADLVFINPFEEPRMNNVHSADISDMISSDAKFCVLLSKTISIIK